MDSNVGRPASTPGPVALRIAQSMSDSSRGPSGQSVAGVGQVAPAEAPPYDPAAALTQPQPPMPVGPEQELWTGRTSWRYFAGRAFLWFLFNAGVVAGAVYLVRSAGKLTWSGASWIMLAAFGVITIMMLSKPLGVILGRRYRITSQRLFIDRGIFARTTDQMELTRVEDLTVAQRFVDRVFGVGTIELLTNDVTDRKVVIQGISNPAAVAEIIRARMRTLRGRSVFVENIAP